MRLRYGYFIFYILTELFGVARNVNAQGGYTINVIPPGRFSDFMQLVNAIGFYVFRIALPVALAVIIYAGVKLLLARGNASEVGEAKNILWWAIVGVAVIVIGSGFICLIKNVIGIPLPSGGGCF